MIISVPKSWNLSHNSFVSKWHWIGRRSSELHEPVIWRVYDRSEICSKLKSIISRQSYENLLFSLPVRVKVCLHQIAVWLENYSKPNVVFLIAIELLNHCTVQHPLPLRRRLLWNVRLILDLSWLMEENLQIRLWQFWNNLMEIFPRWNILEICISLEVVRNFVTLFQVSTLKHCNVNISLKNRYFVWINLPRSS